MDIKNIFKKCISIRETEDGFYLPMRFTKAQEERYDRIEWTPYQRCPAGVTLEFVTDAEEISFDYKKIGVFFPGFLFDVIEDGIYRGSVDVLEEGRFSYKKIVPGKVEMKIFLPVCCEIVLGNFDLGNWEPVPEKEYKHKILMIGDSISQGLFAKHPSLAYIPQIAEFLDADYLNNSVGGDIYDPDTIDTAQGFDPDIIIVAFGTNDACFVGNFEKIEKNMEAFFDKLAVSYPNAKVNVVSMPWETEIYLDKWADFFSMYKKIVEAQLSKAKARGYNAVEGWTLVPHGTDFFADMAHPNDLGNCEFALKLLKKLDY
ncbi:MAG: SGNH/GDSL hydrolase family protein [Ruminococcaceae bacterium]|nr:SGNH/GDSL hydrolase family protein [Oscillospiraceae bacterium]